MLTLLTNPTLPVHTLPELYDLVIYCDAILYPKGTESTTSLAPISLCMHCCSALLAKKPHQPKNLLVNFQYYGCERLDMPTLQAFDSASPFDLTLISRACVSTVTFYYNSCGSRGGYSPVAVWV
ncbi:hypothetical protein PAXRUDRAFT_830923 [Paxillus rubicundulus Ve08.2h10]|uniref:Uncharacterized protein n=1 Tax=Paxillus rubicundulus Ve08.2h10 TaxID=930991 RepID=A0A0D0DST9_9AGAM|nr:hypothetical protein PAXRUDRAFT_830923 [Paxillus rubicundulus Ve08.2h10]